MLSLQQAKVQFGFNPLDEVQHAIARVASACQKQSQFANLGRAATSDLTETQVYIKLCNWLTAQKQQQASLSLQLVRRQCLVLLAQTLAQKGQTQSMMELSKSLTRH